MSDVLMDLHAHYKAIKTRLNGPTPKPVIFRPPEPVVIPTAPLTELAYKLRATELLRGLKCAPEVKQKILPILEKHRMTWREACSRSQRWQYTRCRFEIYARLSAHGWSLPQIGRMCGDRDHTTILSGIRKFIKENLTEEELAVAKEVGMRPVDYYDAKMTLRGWRGI